MSDPLANHQIGTGHEGWNIPHIMGRVLFGRKMVTANVAEITSKNVYKVLLDVHHNHEENRNEIDYLYKYYRGQQPILSRTKPVRPEINNRVIENRANEIVSFKVGYLCGEPIQYISDGEDADLSDKVTKLNAFMELEDKAALDQEIIEWQMICGTAYRLVLPQRKSDHEDDSPFHLYTLDPRNTYVIYANDIYHTPLAGVTYVKDEHDSELFTIYTPKEVIKLDLSTGEQSSTANPVGKIPIFEYPANNSRLGSFEIVLPLLDEINNLDSNRMDGVEQTVQAFLKFINCDIDAETLQQLKEMGAVKAKSVDGLQPEIDVVKTDLDQNSTQTLKEDLYNAVLTICGMPNRNGGKSTSDTGAAVVLRDGWSAAETRAKDSERIYKKAERKMLRLVLDLCAESNLNLKLSDIRIQFTRRNYDNVETKTQVLTTLLASGKVHPLLAFQVCGLFPDAEQAYKLSVEYAEEQEQKMLKQQEDQMKLSAKYSAVKENSPKSNANVERTSKNAKDKK